MSSLALNNILLICINILLLFILINLKYILYVIYLSTTPAALYVFIDMNGTTTSSNETTRKSGNSTDCLCSQVQSTFQFSIIKNMNLASFISNDKSLLTNPTMLCKQLGLKFMKSLKITGYVSIRCGKKYDAGTYLLF